MGKPKTLKSSIKSIQEAITSFNPVPPICNLNFNFNSNFYPTPTTSAFNSIYCTPPTTSTSSSFHDTTFFNCSSSLDDLDPPTGPISSTRFFFSPRTTNSIMEEEKDQNLNLGLKKIGSFDDPCGQIAPEVAGGVPLVLSSDDPYRDFRVSMEEMVEANGVRDLQGLKRLLHCYLRLNHRKTHKVIMLAFVDLIMDLVASQERITSKSSTSPVSLLQLCAD